MAIEIGKYYVMTTPDGERVAKCMQYDINNQPYGIYSVSNYQNSGDAQGINIPLASPEATQEQAQAWEAWYNSNV
jgi:hypothetical protein